MGEKHGALSWGQHHVENTGPQLCVREKHVLCHRESQRFGAACYSSWQYFLRLIQLGRYTLYL